MAEATAIAKATKPSVLLSLSALPQYLAISAAGCPTPSHAASPYLQPVDTHLYFLPNSHPGISMPSIDVSVHSLAVP